MKSLFFRGSFWVREIYSLPEEPIPEWCTAEMIQRKLDSIPDSTIKRIRVENEETGHYICLVKR